MYVVRNTSVLLYKCKTKKKQPHNIISTPTSTSSASITPRPRQRRRPLFADFALYTLRGGVYRAEEEDRTKEKKRKTIRVENVDDKVLILFNLPPN